MSEMINDRKIYMSTVKTRYDTICTVTEITVSELYRRLSYFECGTETHAQFMAAKKSVQDKLKDVGAFIGGKLLNGVRKAGHVEFRDLITLDLDNIPSGQTDTVLAKLKTLGISMCAYSTRKHSPEAPRLRVVIPLARSVTADEYEPIARLMAYIICPDMTWFDRTTFDTNRIMYWPSRSSDSQYVYDWTGGGFLDADGMLAWYQENHLDWRDFNCWIRCPTEDVTHAPATKQEDPLEKKGVVGTFCRVYSIVDVLDKFLPGVYVPTSTPDRYTYAQGSTTGGAIVYENKFLYSHHATDPACDTLCNAFDLVRIHLFGNMDDQAKPGTPTNKLPSYTRMKEFANADGVVQDCIRKEKYKELREDFGDVAYNGSIVPVGNGDDTSGRNSNGDPGTDDIGRMSEWLKLLKTDGNNAYVKSYENVLIALENDPLLMRRVYMNTFTGRAVGVEPLPWGKHKSATDNASFDWTDADDAGLQLYVERLLGVRTKSLVLTALEECRALHQYHPVQNYFQSLIWDGVPRLETVFSDYLGAEDNPYTRALAKMTFVAAVTRIFFPGTKFDTAVVFVGKQGLGKSSFLSIMAKDPDWYTDNIKTLDRSAVENIQGTLIVELSELAALKRNEIEEVKAFLSRTKDRARMAYARNVSVLPRTCILFGTTNTHNFLKDVTGDRRFYPVDVGVIPIKKNVFYHLPAEVDQIWAEAIHYQREGKTALILPSGIMPYAIAEQEKHFDRSDKQGLIENFLNKPVPPDWDIYTLDQRLLFYTDTANPRDDLVPRTKVCAMEIYCECLNGTKERFRNSDGIEIKGILRRLKGWAEMDTARVFPIYGSQKGFVRIDP